MSAKPFLQVIASEALPELDEKYKKWCEEVYIPSLFENPNLLIASHYEIVSGISAPHPGYVEPEAGYAKYLTIYEFGSEEGFKAFGQEMERTLSNATKTWESGEVTIEFQAQYKLRNTWEGKRKAKVGLVNTTGVVLPPEAENAFYQYYCEKAIPTVLANPKLLSADSYELVEGLTCKNLPFTYPKYYNIYKFESLEAFRSFDHSEEMLTNNKSYTKFLESWLPKAIKGVIRAQYLPLKTWA